MNIPVRFALIGAGGVGAYHLSCLETLEREGKLRLAGVADPSGDRLADTRAALEGRGVRWFSNYAELLASLPDLDAVVIATPIPFHFQMALDCLERGLFLCLEKPPVPLLGQLEKLLDADRNNRVSVGFQMILSRNVQRVKAALVEGSLGKLTAIRACACWPRLDGYYARASWAGKLKLGDKPVFDGPATNALAHLVHNIMFLAGAERQGFDVPAKVQGELYRVRPIESYDVACLRGEFRSGVDFVAALAHATEESLPFRLEVRGTKGWMRISEDGARLEGSSIEPVEDNQDTKTLLLEMHREFVQFINGERPRVSTHLADTRGYVLTTNAMLASSGGIHDVDPSWVRTYERKNERGYELASLREGVEEAFASGRLFSEQGLPWATAGSPVTPGSFRDLDILQ